MKHLVIAGILLTASIVYAMDNPQIHFIDVGQGDATFIDIGEFEILIDAGNNQYGEAVSNYIKQYIYGSLDIAVATHPDADHIGGLDIVFRDYPVSTIIDSGKSHTTKTYKEYLNAVYNELGAIFIKDSDFKFNIGEGIDFFVIEIVDDRKDNNENSVVCMLKIKEISFLFMADTEAELEIEFLHKFDNIDVLKVGHHGSKTSTTEEFLEKTKPEYAVISCGKNNRYGHPHREVLNRLEANNVKVFRTDVLGNIIATVYNNNIVFN